MTMGPRWILDSKENEEADEKVESKDDSEVLTHEIFKGRDLLH